MLESIANVLRQQPEAALFLCLAVGFAVGRVKLGPIKLGGICGTLLAALLLGQLGIELSPVVKSFSFALFIFALGFTAGPQLFANLDRSAWRVATLSIVEFVSVVAVVLLASWLLKLDAGSSAGLLAGGATESAVLGTASDAIGHLGLAADQVHKLQANIATVYSISYLCGLVTIVIFTSQVAPRLMRVNLQAEAEKLWLSLGGAGESTGQTVLPAIVSRRYRVGSEHTVGAIEAVAPGRVSVVRVVRNRHAVVPTPQLELVPGDDVLLVGHRAAVIAASRGIGNEEAEELGSAEPLATRELVITNRELERHPLSELGARLRERGHTSLQLASIRRAGKEVPLLPDTQLVKGDVLRVIGLPKDLSHAARNAGYLVPVGAHTDLVLLGGGIVLGYLLGLPRAHLGAIELSLGTGGGALVAGLLCGYLRSKHRRFGTLPHPAAELLKDLGLATFIAAVGLAAGTHALEVVQKFGWTLPVASFFVTLLPALASLLLGRYVLKIAPPILLGAVAGQQCSTPAINTVVGVAGNTTPMLGYTVTYALSNVLLPLLGPLIVALASHAQQ